ncbi:MAG TPA: alpha/beta fold hydrolase [Gordonia sp. (in: high G+C Gram-positive bacteria)]|uniref:AMP-binding protein n=1 Tax=unclassified Gordonia (in: high G+C Gram-positive bacteria) TaxID=2657482 RepID=UPI0025BCD67B|nr:MULTISPECIES: AMP-binding protein [unclassified Gordonia (in: high G+C Gram-positive bacteria)]HNP58213.1 alpha/beta fold hydrolase [Gordonia sp. (in: high G+C Gram-positive bacteria)]HRC52305.1 alpha/beta fold hydrolase [Gordonia sp. (in: high G+C Gram-positive bacteria)]
MGIGGAVNRVLATAQNGLEVLRFGGLDTGTQPAPYQVVETEKMFRLRRYFPDTEGTGPDVILVHPMMVSANIYDVTEDKGAVTILHNHGITPWVVDFGSPDREEGGMERTLADHIVALSRVIDIVIETTGRDVHLAGYSQGGMWVYQTAALRRSKGIASVITYGSPVDVLAALPLGLPAGIAAPGAEFLADKVIPHIYIPGWLARTGFQMLDPVKTARSRLDFLMQLHDRDRLLKREDQRRFLEDDGWVAWSGPAIAELLRQFVSHNRMMSGGFVINGDLVTLAEITCPVLAFVGTADDIGQPAAVRGILRAAPKADVYESRLAAGHFGLVVGSTSAAHTWPTTSEWIRWQAGLGDKPEEIEPMADGPIGTGTGVTLASRVQHGVNAVAEASVSAGKDIVDSAVAVQRTGRAIAAESVRTVPRLLRLGQIQPSTRISLGKLMSENNRRARKKELFLFEDRVLTHEQVNTRIDNVVAGLIQCGVRPGQRVGVLMDTRPSALVVVAALSRLGAVGVLLTTDLDISAGVQLTDARVVVTDPNHLDLARQHSNRVLVLGGGSGDKRVIEAADGETVIDMEKIDPAAVDLPAWYRPDPGLAGDLAFILFTRGATFDLTPWPVTNHRFAISAFGAASAAGLSNNDTVYCLPPLAHPSGLVTTLGATVVGRSRIALSNGVDAETFSAEVLRYGVTVVSYTWTMMREVVRAPGFEINEHNPIRLFMGSGMPTGLWSEVLDSFPHASVLEFFATADGSAILSNVSGAKLGAMGRPLPETSEVKIAGIDRDKEALREGPGGFIVEAGVEDVGVLLSSARQRFATNGPVLTNVFSPHDRWELSNHLFRTDSDGDLWYMGSIPSVIGSADGMIFRPPIEEALSLARGVDQVVVYRVQVGGGREAGGDDLAVAAITTRPDAADAITVTTLRAALGGLPAAQRPHLIQIVDEIQLSEAYRPLSGDLAAAGVPKPGARVWYRDPEGRYRRFTKAVAVDRRWE